MKNTTILIMIVIIIGVTGWFTLVNGKNSVIGNVVTNKEVIPGQIQKVILNQNGYKYNDATAQADKPITIAADNSVSGCLRSVVFNINGKKYSKYLKTPADTLELPALSKGTYPFSCSMGMGYGKLVVQ